MVRIKDANGSSIAMYQLEHRATTLAEYETKASHITPTDVDADVFIRRVVSKTAWSAVVHLLNGCS